MNEFFKKNWKSTTRFCGSFLEKMEWQKWSNKTIVNLPSGLINELLFYYSLFLWISGNLSFISWLKLWSFLFLPFWRNSCFCKKWQSTALRRFQNKAVYLIFSLQMTQLPGNHSKKWSLRAFIASCLNNCTFWHKIEFPRIANEGKWLQLLLHKA